MNAGKAASLGAVSVPVTVHRLRRIVVALHGAADDALAVKHALTLAERLQGELMALFVEDTDLLRLSQWGAVSTFSALGATRRDDAAPTVADALRLQAARLRRAVEQAAAQRRIKCAFQVRQGRLLAEVLAAAGDEDLVVIGWPSPERAAPWTVNPPPAAAVARALSEARARSVLLLHPRGTAPGPVLVTFDDSDAARHGLAIAAQVADQDGGAIDIALTHGRPEEAKRCGAAILDSLSATHLHVALIHAPKADLRTLAEIARVRQTALLVLGAERALVEDDAGRRILQRLDCSVLLAR